MRKQFVRRALLLIGALFAGAQATDASAQDARERTLTIALPSNVNTFDPQNTATVQTDLSVLAHLYSSLVDRGPDLQIRPQLATSWRRTSDTSWRLMLRQGVTFANGEKLDADAVKWNLDRVRDPRVNARIRPWFEAIQEVTVVSETEIEVATREPFPALIEQLSLLLLLPPRWASANNPAVAAMPSGPYELREQRPGDRIVLVARPGYWVERPPFDTVVFRIMPEVSSRIAALLAGEVDFATGVPPSEFQRINQSGRARAGAADSIRTAFIRINTLTQPWQSNRNLRLALNHAVDKQAIVDTILEGNGRVSDCQVLTREYFGFNPDLRPIAYDPARARQLLREAGVTGPITVTFDIPTGVYLLSQEVTQAVAAQLEDVGIRVEMHEMEFGAYMNRYLRTRDLSALSYITQAWSSLDGEGLLSFFEAGNLYSYWNDDQFTSLLRRSRAASTSDERRQLLQQATARMCEEAPVLFLFTQPATYAVSTRVAWRARGDDWVRAWDFALR